METGFVLRRPHPRDRRATLVSLTEHGASVLADMDRDHQELAELLFGDMSARQFDSFVHGLDHVLCRLRDAIQAQAAGGG